MTEEEEFEFRARAEAEKKIPAGPALKLGDVGKTMEEQTTGDVGTALKTGIANAATRTVRGLGTLLLPKSAEMWAESKGYLPTERDVALLEQGTKASGVAQAANIAGEVAATAIPGAGAYKGATALTKAVPIARNRFAQAAIGGGAAGAAGAGVVGGDPVEGALFGAALGPAGTAIGDVGGWGMSKVKKVFEKPEDMAAARIKGFSANPEADAATLRALRGEVAGEAPTAGMAAVADPRMQYMKEIEEQARRRISGTFLEKDTQNQLAREAILEPGATSVTRYPGEGLSEAEALRQRVTAPLYSRSAADRVALTPDLEQRLVMAEANRAASAGDRTFGQGQANAASAGQPIPQGRVAGANQPIARDPSTGATMVEAGPFMPTPATRSIENLQKIRFELDSELNSLSGATDAAGKARFRELQELRNQISNEMRQQSGGFATADTIFRNYSQPVNQGSIDKVLLEALRSPTGKQRNEAFASAWQNAPRTIDRADIPVGRGQHLQEFVTPEHMAQLAALRRSVQKSAEYEAVPRMELPGMESPAEDVIKKIPGFLSKVVTTAKTALRNIGVHSDKEAIKVIDDAAADPQKMAALLERLPPSDRIPMLSAIRERNPKGASIAIMAPATEENN